MQTTRTNLTNAASTQYTNFDFNSMCIFNGVILGAGDEGLFKICCGDDDNGTDIDAYFSPTTTDLGTEKPKSCRYMYLKRRADGELLVSMTGNDETTIGAYSVLADTNQGAQSTRINTGRGLYWDFLKVKIENVDGSDFSISRIDVVI